ncbi:hypothetical protein [Arsenicicoccus piscis]|uniref:Fido domain-containing protein n=2 Tax=Arsenicicoccus piscis TaxID=673954 RepID=A0ABQ6HW69_9MICO|nr:hypothetical protein [Arsenicicoccus piscis]GMA18075.1 hypothetical protein GCM10025862_00960 [Arsenicicoccus piscis]GMA21944.1 hypothetical protein GCM10025862_39650 [Arsenicicoccus piscis]
MEQAREACTQLRWHQALRRRIPEAAAESRVRGAWSSADLDGARLPVASVRDVVRGALSWPEQPDPAERVARSAVLATLEAEHLVRSGVPARQLLARLHTAAAGAGGGAGGAAAGAGAGDARADAQDGVGRPRSGDQACLELTDLGPVPTGPALETRLAGLVELMEAPPEVPAALVSALVHAEVAVLRPFGSGNALVARAAERVLVQRRGLDATGVAVPEVGHRAVGPAAYVGALAGYAQGSADGVALWLRHATAAYVAGAAEGTRIADAVLAGRLS